MRCALVLTLALLGWIGSAQANITKTNWNGLGFQPGNGVVERDVYGNALDAHSSHILLSGGTYYLIGESHGCGFRTGTVGTSCGLSVYTSPDLADGNWTSHGLLIDATIAPWSTVCASNSGFGGCYRPHMVFNAANSNYVLWIQTPGTTAAATVATCTTPLGPCTIQTAPTSIAHGAVGDFSIFVTGGIAYLVYKAQSDSLIYIDQLTSNYLDSTGSTRATGAFGEAPQMFSDAPTGGTTYYMLYGGLCGFCSTGTQVLYLTASTPLGVYSAATSLNLNGCATQPASVDIVVAGGQTNYIYRGDAWTGLGNEGLASFYWQPLTISGGAITPWPTCSATVTVLGITPSPGTYPWPTVDQSNYPSTNGFWQGLSASTNCVVSNAKWCLQTFVPTKSVLSSVGMALGMGNTSCGVPANCVTPDGSLEADLYTIDGSNNPLTLLASVTLPVAQLKWAPQFTMLNFNHAVTPASKYGVVLKPVGLTVSGGFFSVSHDNAHDDVTAGSYPAGKLRKSTDNGATWADNGTNPQAALFSTFGSAPVPFSGVAH